MELEQLILEWDKFKTGNDCILHSGVSFAAYHIIKSSGMNFFEDMFCTGIGVLSIGIVKELYDFYSYGLFSNEDLTYDILGITFAACIHYRSYLNKKPEYIDLEIK